MVENRWKCSTFCKAFSKRTAENVERVWAAINKDQQLTVRELEADLGIPKTTVSEISTQGLGMKCENCVRSQGAYFEGD